MANLAQFYVYKDGDILTAAQLNGNDANLRENFMTLISPLGGSLNVNSQSLTNIGSAVFSDVAGNPTLPGQLLLDGTILKFFDGSIVRNNQVLHSVSQSGIVSGTAIEAVLYTFTVPAFVIGTAGQVVVHMKSRFGLLAGSNVAIRASYGAGSPAQVTISNASGVTAALTLCPITVTISGNVLESTQSVQLECNITSSQSNLVNVFAATETNLSQVAVSGTNSTIANALHINVLFSSADGANQCDYLTLQTIAMS
jgi:hypothetical protein